MPLLSRSRLQLALATLAAAALAPGSVAAAPANEPAPEASLDLDESKRTLLVAPPPGMTPPPGDAGPVFAKGRRVVYLNFEGVTLTRSNFRDDATTNESAIVVNSTQVIAAFNPSSLSSTGGLTRQQIINRVVSDLEKLHEPYDVEFVTARPSGGHYSMVVFGGSCSSVAGANCAGIALLDCGDQMPSNITFVFPGGLRVADLATTAAQEAAHAFGLGHTDDQNDVMYPYIQGYIPTRFGKGNVPDGSACNNASYQDSHQLMLDIIGPRGQDVTPPSVKITAPANGATVTAGTPVTATVTDDVGVASVDLQVGSDIVDTRTAPPWEFTIPAAPDGELQVRVIGRDVNGNSASDRIFVTMAADADLSGQLGDPCTTNADCASGSCGTSGDDSYCTQSCDVDAEASCPDGFQCVPWGESGGCWPADGTSSTGGGICSATDTSRNLPALALLTLLLTLTLRRRATAR